MGNITSCDGTSVSDNNRTSNDDYIGNLTSLENSRTTMLYIILPPALLGIALNILCLVFFLRRERKGTGNQMLIGLAISDVLVCLSSPASLFSPVNGKSLGARVFDGLAGISYVFTQEFMWILWYLRVITIYKPLVRIKPRKVWICIASEISVCCIGTIACNLLFDPSDYFSGGKYFPLEILEILSWGMLTLLISILVFYSGLLVVTWKAMVVLEKQVSIATEENMGVKKRALETLNLIVAVQLLAIVYQLCVEVYIMVLLEDTLKRYEGDQCVGLEENLYTAFSWVLTFYIQSTLSSLANPVIHIVRNRNLNTWVRGMFRPGTPSVAAAPTNQSIINQNNTNTVIETTQL